MTITNKELWELDLGVWSSVDEYASYSGNGRLVKRCVFLFNFYKKDYITIYISNERDNQLNMPIIKDEHIVFRGKVKSKDELSVILTQVGAMIN